ncbi:MAG: Cof-type HAD-IIB family hydrolase [Bacillota bacterium]
MTIRLVAMDLDDTLLDSRLQISHQTARMLQRVVERGIKITLATGRMFRSAQRYAVQLGMNVPLITYQGALVKNAFSDEVLFHRKVPLNMVIPVVAAAREAGYHYQVYFDDNLYMESLTPEGQAYAELAGVTPVVDKDLLTRLTYEEPTKIIIINYNLPALQQMETQLQQRFSEQLYITRSKPHYLEFLNKEATKGRALQAVSEYFAIDRRDVMAIGDSYNDIEMLKWAGIGVAVGNAPPEVKRHADYVTVSNDEDGVAAALQHLILKEPPE